MRTLRLTVCLAALALAPGVHAEEPTLPRQTDTHFFEIYHCGELAGVVWVKPDSAALYRLGKLGNPAVRRAALEARRQAEEAGQAYAVHGMKGDCTAT